MNIQESVVEKFLRYVKINTRSDDTINDRCPTTEVQWDLARLLADELKSLGLEDALVDDKCFVLALSLIHI